jgi:hypothetical protein
MRNEVVSSSMSTSQARRSPPSSTAVKDPPISVLLRMHRAACLHTGLFRWYCCEDSCSYLSTMQNFVESFFHQHPDDDECYAGEPLDPA